jgi:hypothetical protein
MNITKHLSELHTGLYDSSFFEDNKQESIIGIVKEDFQYLYDFYMDYSKGLSNSIVLTPDNSLARNTDLPFIGENVLKNNKAKFFFVFEGSRQIKDKLSITVLSHLWLKNDDTIKNKYFEKDKWWTKINYQKFYERFSTIDNLSMVASHSYITDAVRYDDDKASIQLIEEEIKLLKPDLVVCVGSKARYIVGMKYYDNTKFHHVPFPVNWNKQKLDEYYKELNSIISKFP